MSGATPPLQAMGAPGARRVSGHGSVDPGRTPSCESGGGSGGGETKSEKNDVFVANSLPNKSGFNRAPRPGAQNGAGDAWCETRGAGSRPKINARRQSVDVSLMRLPVCQTQTGVTHDDIDLLSGLAKVKLDETGIIKANSLNTILGFDTGENGDGDEKKVPSGAKSVPKRNLSFTEGSTRTSGDRVWTSYNPATGPRG